MLSPLVKMIFFSLLSFKSSVTPLERPVSYDVIQTYFKFMVSEVGIPVGISKMGLHCMRKGGVTQAVRNGAVHSVVQKCMRVKSLQMVPFYASLGPADLCSALKLAF